MIRIISCFILFLMPFLSAASGDSIRRKNPVVKNFIVPVSLISLGVYNKYDDAVLNRFEIKKWRDTHYPNFSNHADDAMQFIPIGLVYGLDLLKVKAKNDLLNRSLLLIKTEILVNGITQFLKHTSDVTRPNGSNEHSFPSGHTAQAFAAATFMHKELGHHSIWISVGAYTMATSVGVMRVLNNKHWSSDVLVGAGIGILGTNLVYLTHRYKWGKRPDLVLLPTYNRGPGIYASLKFN